MRLSLDDFGEGYSSLSHIQRLPIHGLKIARPFVKGWPIPRPTPGSSTASSSSPTASSSNLVAEGIELPEQQEALRSFGCPARPGIPVRAAGAGGCVPRAARGLAQRSGDLSVCCDASPARDKSWPPTTDLAPSSPVPFGHAQAPPYTPPRRPPPPNQTSPITPPPLPDADVAAVDDLDVGALDQLEPEVTLQEEREAEAGGGPAPVDAVAAASRS